MAVQFVLAAVAVSDMAASRGWYAKLLGRPADDAPMPQAVELRLAGGGSIQLVQDLDRAGQSLVTIPVDDIEAQIADIRGRGFRLVEGGPPSEDFRLAQIADPDGNVITFAEDIRGDTAIDDAHVGWASDEAPNSIG